MRALTSSLVAVVLLAAAQSLAAEPPSALANLIRERCESHGLAPESADALIATLQGAVEKGLPPESIADKILEGLAKGVQPDRIAKAAENVTLRLQGAKEAFLLAGSAPRADQLRTELDRLALAIQATDRASILALARDSRGAPASDLVEAARQLAQLRARGIGAEAIPALAALAAAGKGAQATEVVLLLDEYRAEGGEDVGAFFNEVADRAKNGIPLDDLVDPFGDGPDPLRRAGGRSKGGMPPGLVGKPGKKPLPAPALEKNGRAGAAPGLDVSSPGRKEKDCLLKKNENACK